MPASIPPPSPSPVSAPRFYGLHNTVFEVTLHEPAGTTPPVPEALVQDLWQSQRLARPLHTSDGALLTVLSPGTLNTDAGPDFTDAHLRIGSDTWVGDVEIHTTSGGWFNHKHHLDASYNNVVLHVALYADVWTGNLLRADDYRLPEVVAYPYLDAPLRRLLYDFYTQPSGDLLCASRWARVPDPIRNDWIRDLAAERMQAKKNQLAAAFLHTPDLTLLLYERLFAGLGYAKNTRAMTTLARRLAPDDIRRLADPLDREALFLGAAGLLPAPADLLHSNRVSADYVMNLRDRFDRLRLHTPIPVMDKTAWRFFRLRPANFPPLRIAQGASWFSRDGLLHHDPIGKLVGALQADDSLNALRTLLHTRPGPFWDTHVRLEKTTRPFNPAIGRTRLNALLVNAVAPILLLYAEQTNDAALAARTLDVLQQLPAEKDEVTRRFEALGTRPRNALTAQGVHQLYRTRCTQAHCLTCPIGQFFLEATPSPPHTP